MKSLYFLFLFLLGLNLSFSQTYEIGPIFGNTTFIGDVGATKVIGYDNYFDTEKLSYGLLFRWNRSKRHSFRFSYMRFNTFGRDSDSAIQERQQRNLEFSTSIDEISLGLEFTFWEWDLHSSKRPQFVPYLSTGVAYFFTDHYARAGNELVESGDLNSFAIPLTIGAKTTIGRRFVLSTEFSARYTFTDNMDGSAPSELDNAGGLQAFGNPNSNDWYIFAGISLTYTFGRKPCYNCDF